jgi:zinc protease
MPKEGKGKEAFGEMLTEIERVTRFGFTASELKRAKAYLLNEYQTFYNKRDKISHEDWANQLYMHFLTAEPVFTPEKELQLATNAINSIELSELNGWAKLQVTQHNRVILVTGPDKDKDILPSEEDLKGILNKLSGIQLEAYAEEETNENLISENLKAGTVKTNFKVKGIDAAKGYVLSNGAKVVLLSTTYNKDQVLFSAYSPGGRSLVDLTDLPSADAAVTLHKVVGISEFDAVQLQKMLTGKTVRLNPFILELQEGFNGSSSVKDFETMLQLAYLSFASPRFDNQMATITMQQWENYTKNRQNNTVEAFRDSTDLLNANRSKRVLLFNENFVKNVNFDKAQEIYKNRFQNAADFTFVIIGNVDEKTALPLIEKYIGSIKSTGKTEKFIDHNLRPAKGNSKLYFSKPMEVPKATVCVNFNGELKYNLLNRLCVNTIEQLLSKRYLESIREEEGGSYGVVVRGQLSMEPKEEFSLFLRFDCDPAKQEKLLAIVWKEIEDLKNGKVVAKDLNEIKQNFVKMRKEDVEQNEFWLNAVQVALKSPEGFVNDADYEKTVQLIDEKMVVKVAKQMFSKANTTEVVMKSE